MRSLHQEDIFAHYMPLSLSDAKIHILVRITYPRATIGCQDFELDKYKLGTKDLSPPKRAPQTKQELCRKYNCHISVTLQFTNVNM